MPPSTTQISDPKIAFAYLRPACVLLTRQASVDNVEKLLAQLKDVDDATLQQLQDYILFPLRFVLKSPGSKEKDELVQVTVEAMSHVLERTCVPGWDTVRELLSEVCMCIRCQTEVGKLACTSEELKLAVLRCLDALLHAAYGDIFFKLFEPTMLLELGATVSLLLSLAETEKCRQIQTAALKCLLVLTLECDCGQDHLAASAEERQAAGASMASFLPGVTRAMTRMITGDLRQGHLVTVGAIKVWSASVGLVLEDVQLQASTSPQAPAADLGRTGHLMAQRSESWVKNTSEKLCLLLKNIISCTSAHRHWKVRLQTVELAARLLHRCERSLGECVSLLLEALVGAINDEEARVKERCEEALKDLSMRNQTSSSSQSFTDVLSENLHSLCTSLPRLMRTSNDQKKLFILNIFLGYLKLLGPLVTVVLNSAAHLERMSKALMQVLELDVKDVRIVEERNLGTAIEAETSDFSFTHTQRKHFLLFTDDKIFSVLMEICRTLGYYGNIYLLTDHFLDLYRQSQSYRKQAATVLNQLIRGAAGHSVVTAADGPSTSLVDLTAVVQMVLDEYMSANNWQLLTAAQDRGKDPRDLQPLSSVRLLSIADSGAGPLQVLTPSSSCSLLQLNSNIWQLCLQLEGVSCCAQALGTHFRPLLMTSLYPVLEKAGEETLLVSQAALSCLWAMARACRYQTLTEMINFNCDYLLSDVSLNMQRLTQHPEAPRVLTVMLAHSDRSLLPLVGDIVQDVLTALDLSYDRTAPLFCCVLLALMQALARWFPSALCPTPTKSPPPPTRLDDLDVRQFLLDYQKQKDLAEGRWVEGVDDQDDEIPPPCDLPPDDDDEKKGELPPHLSVTKDVMERCVHLLSHPDLGVRLKVLDVLELCVRLLSEKEDELLPMVHRCWPALLQRLTGDDPLAILRAFRVSLDLDPPCWSRADLLWLQVLCTLGERCGDFLRRRVSKEVLPKLSSSLLHQAPVSARAGPIYTHTLAYKLQLAVLQGLGSLCQRLELGEPELEQVCDTCLPYLSSRQPAGLQEACLSVFRILARLDPDLVWFILNEVHCPTSYDSPHPDLPPVLLSGAGRPRDEFSDNIAKLLREELS